jgi:sterol desaturase/sphingolipid hydroxylase (fatty acid hydroxylase superfamily)
MHNGALAAQQEKPFRALRINVRDVPAVARQRIEFAKPVLIAVRQFQLAVLVYDLPYYVARLRCHWRYLNPVFTDIHHRESSQWPDASY